MATGSGVGTVALRTLGRCGGWGFEGLEVGGDGSVGEGLSDVAGDVAGLLVAAVHRPASGHQHVDGDELAGAGLPGLEFVE